MNMVRIRHIIEMRRALKAPPLLPPKVKRKQDPGGTADKRIGPKDIVVISFELRELNTELFYSPHVICLFYESAGGSNGPWRLQTSSDVLDKATEIDLPDAFAIEYSFEKSQYIKVEICSFTDDDTVPIGFVVFSVSEVICSKTPFSAPIINEVDSASVGCSIIRSRARSKQKEVLLQFCGKNIPKKGMFDGAQIYFQIFRVEDNGDKSFVYKSEQVKYAVNVVWRQFTLHRRILTDVPYRKLEVVCYWKGDGGKQLVIGHFITTYDQLEAAVTPQNHFCLSKEKNGKKTCAIFEVMRCNELCIYTFLDYITTGFFVDLAVVVDFSCPHYSYVDDIFVEDVDFAIRTIGEQIKGYGSSNTFASFGIGAKIPPLYRESHQFCLNLETDAICHGIDGIIDAFHATSMHLQPTPTARFAHVIYHVSKYADNLRKRDDATNPQYFVLLVITRGYIDDLRETIQAIIFASRAPISIVFVGVGNGDFAELERLGMAGCRLVYQNRRIDRDMMQFVNQTKIRNSEEQLDDIKDAICEIALSQVPWQMAKWMMKNGVKPEDGRQSDDDPEVQQLPSTSTPQLRRRLTTVRYDSIMGTLSDSDEAERSPTTSNPYANSFFNKSFNCDYYTGPSDKVRSRSSESYLEALQPDL